ncbi:hypothetical protein JCM10212_000115 [Sporobolomyces blumeae]
MERVDVLKAAFGENGQAFEDVLVNTGKVELEAYKFKIKQSIPVWKARGELAKKVPDFWHQALRNHQDTSDQIDLVDDEALKHLKEVWLEYSDKDVRDFEITLTFSPKNPYFKETTIKKKLTATPPKGTDSEPVTEYDLDAPLYLEKCTPITWTSPEHDLTKKAPRVDPLELEENDEYPGPGSIFNWFLAEGLDETGLGEHLAQVWGSAVELAAGMQGIDSDEEFGSEIDSEAEEDIDDSKKEIDLSDDEKRPKKKQRQQK